MRWRQWEKIICEMFPVIRLVKRATMQEAADNTWPQIDQIKHGNPKRSDPSMLMGLMCVLCSIITYIRWTMSTFMCTFRPNFYPNVYIPHYIPSMGHFVQTLLLYDKDYHYFHPGIYHYHEPLTMPPVNIVFLYFVYPPTTWRQKNCFWCPCIIM